jgi:hypothetical protein
LTYLALSIRQRVAPPYASRLGCNGLFNCALLDAFDVTILTSGRKRRHRIRRARIRGLWHVLRIVRPLAHQPDTSLFRRSRLKKRLHHPQQNILRTRSASDINYAANPINTRSCAHSSEQCTCFLSHQLQQHPARPHRSPREPRSTSSAFSLPRRRLE